MRRFSHASFPTQASATPAGLTERARLRSVFRAKPQPCVCRILRKLQRLASVAALAAALPGRSAAPSRINDLCAVFDQKAGWFEDWKQAAELTQRKRGVPVPVLMATLRKESGFQHDAKPPRTWLLGFIPWKRVSTAYGYSQALDATWAQYQRETGNESADRTDFADAVDFVGWYHAKTAKTFGVARRRRLQSLPRLLFRLVRLRARRLEGEARPAGLRPRDRADGARLRRPAQVLRPCRRDAGPDSGAPRQGRACI